MAVLTPATYPSGTPEQKLAYLEECLAEATLAKQVTIRGKTVMRDAAAIQKVIDKLKKDNPSLGGGLIVAHTKHARRT